MSIFDEHDNVRVGRVWAYVAGIVAAGVVIWWIVAVASASTSGARGTLDIKNQRGGSANRIQQAVTIRGDFTTIQADQQKIKIYASAAAAPTATQFDAVNLTGVESTCNDDVAKYNTDANVPLAVLPDGYPSSLDATQVCAANSTGLITP